MKKTIEDMKIKGEGDDLYDDLEHFDPQKEPLLKEDPNRFVIFPITYPGKL